MYFIPVADVDQSACLLVVNAPDPNRLEQKRPRLLENLLPLFALVDISCKLDLAYFGASNARLRWVGEEVFLEALRDGALEIGYVQGDALDLRQREIESKVSARGEYPMYTQQPSKRCRWRKYSTVWTSSTHDF